jgi:hypothetical protein
MGSNLALCADEGQSSACSGSPCLWDGDAAAGSRAYCTIACDPSTSGSCPAHFQCRAQGCSSGPANVCVRIEADPKPTSECTDIVSGRSAIVSDVVQGRDGRLFALLSLSSPSERAFFTRGPSEASWTRTYTLTAMFQQNSGSGPSIAADDALYYVVGNGLALRMSGTQVTEEHYATCSSNCSNVVESVYATSSGAVRLVESDGQTVVMRERAGSGSWSVVTEAVARRFVPIAHFSKGGFVALCRDPQGTSVLTPCIGDTGQDLVDLALPSGALPRVSSGQDVVPVLGTSKEDFWVFSDTGKLFHRVGAELLEEGLPAPATASTSGGLLMKLADGTVVAMRGTETFALEQGCWRSIAESVTSGYPTSGRRVGSLSGTQLCEGVVP